MKETTFAIADLTWRLNWRIPNGGESFVVPFPTLRPATIVFHGEDTFQYGHYGIHLGQADILTFLGPATQEITGHFIDCRAGSATVGVRETRTWQPGSRRNLYIPAGVAHAFDGLEHIHTLNTYELFLPEPKAWLSGQLDWRAEADVINLPMTVPDEDVPLFTANSHAASEVWYQLVARQQAEALPQIEHEYPFTNDVTLDNGEKHRIELRKRRDKSTQSVPEWEPVKNIDGVGWVAHPVFWSGPKSGFVPLVDARPLYFVDHGTAHYAHDAYGIHLGQEDHLTFVGPHDQTVTLRLADTRKHSATFGHEVTVAFQPSALRYLKIPNGVAHAFDGLENITTFNRASTFLPENGEIETGSDVIDWPLHQRPYPALEPYLRPADQRFYQRQVAEQQQAMLAGPVESSTPAVLLTQDTNGNSVRVALRKKTDAHSPVAQHR